MNEPDLIGYLLDLLDGEERAAVGAWLAESPARQEQLARLGAWLQALPLNDDPPGDLHYFTLRRIAGFEVEHRRQATRPVFVPQPVVTFPRIRAGLPRRWLQLATLAAAIVTVAALLPPAILQARHRQEILACQNNLRLLHAMLKCYAENHGECLPSVPERGPLAFAGVFVLFLREEQAWDNDISMICPANRRKLAVCSREKADSNHMAGVKLEKITRKELTSWAQASEHYRQLYQDACRQLGGCYAYHLGYRYDGRLVGLQLKDEGWLPVLGDRPPRFEEEPEHRRTKNSPNHAGFGQNVLLLSGHVRFQRYRHCSGLDDDIYLNRHHQLAAGCDCRDVVLGPSEASPCGVQLADNR